MRTLILLACLLLYGTALWFIEHDRPKVVIDPRAYHCEADLPCANS